MDFPSGYDAPLQSWSWGGWWGWWGGLLKGASNWLKIEYVVGACMYIDVAGSFFGLSKLLWEYSDFKSEILSAGNFLKNTLAGREKQWNAWKSSMLKLNGCLYSVRKILLLDKTLMGTERFQKKPAGNF